MQSVTTLAELNDLAGAGKLKGLVRVSNDLYHSGPGLSSTGIKELLKSPAHYQAYLGGQEDSAAMLVGRAIHCRLLEPELFHEAFVVAPQVDARTKEGKAARDQFMATSMGREVLSSAENLLVSEIYTAAQMNSLAKRVFLDGQAEMACYWTDEETGVLCKARADYIKGEAIFDVKTTSYGAGPTEFPRTIVNYQYGLSAAFYLDGFARFLPVKHFSWVAIEKKRPFGMGFYAATEEILNAGRADYRRALDRFAECDKSGSWPAYEEKFINITLNGAV